MKCIMVLEKEAALLVASAMFIMVTFAVVHLENFNWEILTSDLNWKAE